MLKNTIKLFLIKLINSVKVISAPEGTVFAINNGIIKKVRQISQEDLVLLLTPDKAVKVSDAKYASCVCLLSKVLYCYDNSLIWNYDTKRYSYFKEVANLISTEKCRKLLVKLQRKITQSAIFHTIQFIVCSILNAMTIITSHTGEVLYTIEKRGVFRIHKSGKRIPQEHAKKLYQEYNENLDDAMREYHKKYHYGLWEPDYIHYIILMHKSIISGKSLVFDCGHTNNYLFDGYEGELNNWFAFLIRSQE